MPRVTRVQHALRDVSRRLSFAGSLILLLLAPLVGRAQTSSAAGPGLDLDARPPKSAYDRLVAEAVAEHSVEHWAEARALFLRAHRLEPSARTLRALGMTAFELREYPDAVRELEAALSATRHPLSGAQRKQVQGLLERANTFVGRYRLELEPPHARVEVSGMELKRERDGTVLLGLGRHLLSVQAIGYRDAQRTVVVDGSDGETIHFALEPLWWAWDALPPPIEPASDPTIHMPAAWTTQSLATDHPWNLRAYVWTWVASGTAVALAGSSLALRARANRVDDTRPESCGVDCDPWSPDKRDRLRQFSAATLGASLAFAASAVAIYFFEARAARDNAK